MSEIVTISFALDEVGKKTQSEEKKAPQDAQMTDDELRKEKRSVRTNLICVFVSCLLIQSPFLALANSVTSLFQSEGIGFSSLAVGGIAQPVAGALLVTYATKVWGIRKIVSLSMILPLIFNLSFFYPVKFIIIPAGAFVGLTQALFTSASFMYGNILGFWYSKITNGNVDNLMAMMSGIINSTIGGGFLIGNILLYVILDTKQLDSSNSTNTSTEQFEICGKNYCNEDLSHMTTMKPPEPWRYYTMIGVFAAMTGVGILLSFFLRDFATNLGHTHRKKSEFFVMLKEMCLLLKDPRGYLLIVLPLFVGIEEGFILSDFTQAYISCVVGIPSVGLLMFGFGISQIVFSGLQWILAKYLGRILTVFFGVALLLGCFVYLLLWIPDPDQIMFLAIISVVWSAGDAIVISTVFAVYSLMFEDNVEGSFAVGNFWLALGYLIAFVWSQLLCIKIKLYVMVAVGGLGLISYVCLEILVKREKKTTKS